MLTFQA